MSNREYDGISLKEFITIIDRRIKFLFSKWLSILLFAVLGGLIGFLVSYLSAPKFVAESNIVVEGESQSLGGLSAFGIGGNAPSGLFSSVDNVIWLYTNSTMLRKALLSDVNSNVEKSHLLIQDFMSTSLAWEKKLEERKNLSGVKITYNDMPHLSRKQEDVLKICINIIKADYLKVQSVKKTEGIINVKFAGEDEAFAYNFVLKLVSIVNDYYITTKTQNVTLNIVRLEKQADSLRDKVNLNLIKTASSTDNSPYANPNLSVLKVAPQKAGVDVQANTSLYLQVMTNIELAKNDLAKQTPIVRVIDEPLLPLTINKIRWTIAVPLGVILFTFLSMTFLLIKQLYKESIVVKQ